MFHWFIDHLNIYVILASLFVAGSLIIVIGLLVFFLPVPPSTSISPAAAMTIIPAPTSTIVPTRVVATPTATPPPSVDGISIGSYVQIAGTEGQGLRLRSGPGTENPPRFLGMDAEVFLVKDGPKQSGGFIWWFLEAPYDPSRSGWAAAQYLAVVNPTATPE
jgi:hypothetical protein